MQTERTSNRRRRQRRKPRRTRPRTLELPWPESTRRPVFRTRRVHTEIDRGSRATPYGGLALAHQLVQGLNLPRAIDHGVPIFKIHLPYHESDHLLTHVYNLFAGGTCIEDIASLQDSEAFRNLVGACRVPDPTTAGDFLRRFDPQTLSFLTHVFDETHEKVWAALPRAKRRMATVDLDSTIKPVYGECKEGADFSYTGKWSYHPLLISVAETNECLRLINRSGNRPSAEGSGEALDECLGRLTRHFRKVRVRGDTAFGGQETVRVCDVYKNVEFAFGLNATANLVQMAENLSPRAFRPFDPRPPAPGRGHKVMRVRRRRRRRTRRARARARGYDTLRTVRESVAEFPYRPGWADRDYRIVVRRQLVETSRGQEVLFEQYRYRFFITNIPDMTPAEVVRFAYGRCNQENTIEQLKNGMATMKMPTGELVANAAFLMAGQLAWNLRAWLSLLALPEESLRWEWKRFRHAFVYVAARVVRKARRVCVRITASHRFAAQFLAASERLDALVFR